ncbi:MAG: metallophosphoesterase family protein [Terriglobia bacterium]
MEPRTHRPRLRRYKEFCLRYLILSDLHASIEALEACLRLAEGRYECAICLGDIVGYGPDPGAVIDRIRQQTSVMIRGNHDRACSGIADPEDFNPWAKAATYWTRASLSEDRLTFLRELQAGPMAVAGFAMVHGSALDEDQYVMGLAQALPLLQTQQWPVVFFGHTHYQGGFSLDSSGGAWPIAMDPGGTGSVTGDGCVVTLPIEDGARYLVNPGSVGQPRDGNWRSAFAIFDDAGHRVEYYRTSYDLAGTQRKMIKVGLPEALIRRLEVGR